METIQIFLESCLRRWESTTNLYCTPKVYCSLENTTCFETHRLIYKNKPNKSPKYAINKKNTEFAALDSFVFVWIVMRIEKFNDNGTHVNTLKELNYFDYVVQRNAWTAVLFLHHIISFNIVVIHRLEFYRKHNSWPKTKQNPSV